jgi:hypothetical protein
MTDITAATVLARFHYKSTDFDPATSPDETVSLINVEYVIDDAIDFINLEAGTSIGSLAGVAGAKTVSVTNDENAALKLLLGIMLHDTKEQMSSSFGLGPVSGSESLSKQSQGFVDLFERALNRLRGSSFQRA